MKESIEILAGHFTGGQLITGTDAVTGKWRAIMPIEDTVIEEFFVNGVDVCAARGFNTQTLPAGVFIAAGLNNEGVITSVHLTSGRVMAY